MNKILIFICNQDKKLLLLKDNPNDTQLFEGAGMDKYD